MIAHQFSRMCQCDPGNKGIKVVRIDIDVQTVAGLECANDLIAGVVVAAQFVAIGMEDEFAVIHHAVI